MRVLIIEDEYNLADVISESLKKEKYQVDIRTDGEDGYYDALTGIYDLIILDVMLPHMNGFDILKGLREENIDSKIIMLTARGELSDKLHGFSNGANDYLAKPFHIEELLARVNAQLKNQTSIEKKDILEYGDLSLDINKSTVSCLTNNQKIELVCKEFQLLEYFMKNNEQILSREQIYDKVWGMENEIESNNLEAYLSFIRKKLKAIDSKTNIKSCRGLGYKMEYTDE